MDHFDLIVVMRYYKRVGRGTIVVDNSVVKTLKAPEDGRCTGSDTRGESGFESGRLRLVRLCKNWRTGKVGHVTRREEVCKGIFRIKSPKDKLICRLLGIHQVSNSLYFF